MTVQARGGLHQVRIDPLPRQYPLPAPADDDRFTFGLVIDMADGLHTHGFPRLTSGADLVALQQAIFRFLYDTTRVGDSTR